MSAAIHANVRPLSTAPMDKKLLVVIDAQRAFVDPAGSLARAVGIDEIQPSIRAFERLKARLSDRGSETALCSYGLSIAQGNSLTAAWMIRWRHYACRD